MLLNVKHDDYFTGNLHGCRISCQNASCGETSSGSGDPLEYLDNYINNAREHAGLTGNEMAERLVINQLQVWCMENRTEMVSAEAYGIDPYGLLIKQANTL